MRTTTRRLAALLLFVGLSAGTAGAVPCGGDFDQWLEAFKREAADKGISQRTIGAALAGVTPDPKVLSLDRNQRHFNLSFEEFVSRRVGGRIPKGQRMLLQHASMLARIEAQYGVPPAVLVAIWGLESDYGANTGNMSVIRSLATLAHDCRRTDRFQAELLDALRIVERGDLSPAEMRGAWAGELGQTQFLPSSYIKFAVDFDGSGRRDLIRSVPDVLASTANYLRSYGWRRGQPWGEGTHNFSVLREWNKSEVYARTVGYFAERLAEER